MLGKKIMSGGGNVVFTGTEVEGVHEAIETAAPKLGTDKCCGQEPLSWHRLTLSVLQRVA